ncbi:H-X9-DG-CTERM domain-containing protein [Symmachiella macrocystis]|uniref:H-X9-DG-CTERM domain-containing protein n=1 Tax=Symmachiella macrocystis TaxID=2527985 RepID=UPI0036F39900
MIKETRPTKTPNPTGCDDCFASQHTGGVFFLFADGSVNRGAAPNRVTAPPTPVHGAAR